MTAPKPGSEGARELGCKCPVLANYHGKGRSGDGNTYGWLVDSKCELHRIPAVDALLKAVGGDNG